MIRTTTKNAGLFVVLSIVFACIPGNAAPLFENDDVLDIELAGPIQALLASKTEKNELPVMLRVDGTDYQIKLRTRGNSRLRVCEFPPLQLNFATKTVAGTVFADQDKLKLVTHCRNHDRAEQDLLQEYLAYRLFNIVSELSYRVRLLRITYTDAAGEIEADARSRFGFAIESSAEFADRTGSSAVMRKGLSRNSLEQEQAALVYVFHYLIGNTDWSITSTAGDEFCCHNGDLFTSGSELFLVPYDFDLSGLVNARYAKPDRSLPIFKVTSRLYRGFCLPSGALELSLQKIIENRAAIMALPDSVPGLSAKESKTSARYLKGFFDKAENQQKFAASLHGRCI